MEKKTLSTEVMFQSYLRVPKSNYRIWKIESFIFMIEIIGLKSRVILRFQTQLNSATWSIIG